MAKTYRESIEARLEILREKLRKAQASEKFHESQEGQIILDHIQEQVNEHFKAMSEGLPLDREEYLVRHAALTVYRGMAKAIFSKAEDKNKLEEEIKDVSTKLELQDEQG